MSVVTSFKDMILDVLDRIMPVVLIIIAIATTALVSIVTFVWVNEVAIKEVVGVSKQVVEKKFSPADTQTTLILVGKVHVPFVQNSSDTWSLCFQLEQDIACGSVDQSTYNKTEVGQFYLVSYGVGRLDGRHIVNSIQQQ